MVSIRMLSVFVHVRLEFHYKLFFSFWDESFVFDCDDKSNEIRLKIFDRKKSNKKLNADISMFMSCDSLHVKFLLFSADKLYTDVSIPFSYVTSTIYKEDVRITPQYPESIIRIEVNHQIHICFCFLRLC